MPKKQTKPKYPKEIFVAKCGGVEGVHFLGYAYDSPDDIDKGEVAIYQFVRMAKVKRTVTVLESDAKH